MNELFPPPPVQYGMRFTVGEHSAGHVRRIVRAYLRHWGMPDLTDPVGLAITELLANVLRHVPDRNCELLVLWQPYGVRVEVSDSSADLPTVSAPDNDSEGGRGLVLVEAMTDEWGVEPTGGGKTVWFECGTPKEDERH
ncbi:MULTISPECIES: ATP-binding protein [unclassified Streptomyces]|uniref:ATP-binding protein n=1 Tax=unclassified Streptomyces TaxID=2593676 RepID=UPI00386E1151